MATGDDTRAEIRTAGEDVAAAAAKAVDMTKQDADVVAQRGNEKDIPKYVERMCAETEIDIPEAKVEPSSPGSVESLKREKSLHVASKNVLTLRLVDSIRTGIKRAVSGPASKTERDLLMQDFMTVETTTFSSSGPTRFVFRTYAPVAFSYFRELFGINADNFLESFDGKGLKELSDSGKSGSILYVTGDDRFIVKTMQSKECSFLQKLLPGYYMNLHQNPDTLLPKYFGLYCYRCDMKKMKLVAMNNILPSSIEIGQRYDLKGATYKRRASSYKEPSDRTYKDLDFIRHHPDGLYLDADSYNDVMKTIKRDCTVLESFKIMDYSLLLGISKTEGLSSMPAQAAPLVEKDTEPIHSTIGNSPLPKTPAAEVHFHCPRVRCKTATHAFPHRGLPALDGDGNPILIFMGIIDILQSYRLKKKLEHAWKSVIHDGDTVSVHRPAFYSSRFQKFMAEKVFKRLTIPAVKRKTVKPFGAKLRHRSPDCDTQPTSNPT